MDDAVLHQIDAQLVRGSFPKVFARKAELTEHFYLYLFQAIPEVEAMFSQDFSRQKEMFARALATGMRSLDGDEQLAPVVERLLLNHRGLGLTSGHMDIAHQALFQALEDIMTGHLTAAELSAWNTALRRLCQSMASGIETSAT